MEILLGLVTGLFWPILIVAFIVWLVKRSSGNPKSEYIGQDSEYRPADSFAHESTLRMKIATEIRAQIGQYKTPLQKKVVEDMAQTVEYFATHSYQEALMPTQPLVSGATDFVPANTGTVIATEILPIASQQVAEPTQYETPWNKLQLLDGATILLYLGAFFVLASIGLYVALGQGGAIKALLVTLITIIFYASGIMLFKYSARLKPAGLTFVAIGMATLPMAGAAIYYFALDEQSGSTIWLVTSITAVILYAHAVYVLRSTLVSYMVVFSTLSVVLASISSSGLAPYYFIQGIGFAGLLFAIGSKLMSKNDIGLTAAYERSAMFLVPFSAGMAALFVTQIGWLQLALSLLLAATYYLYAAIIADSNRQLYALLAQVMGIASLIVGGYGFSEKLTAIAIIASLVAAAYTCIWMLWARIRVRDDPYRVQVKYLLLFLPYVAIGALFMSPGLLWLAVSLTLLTSMIVYLSDRCWSSGFSWLISVLSLPLLISYFTLENVPSASKIGFAYLALGFIALLSRYIIRLTSTLTDRSLLLLLMLVSQLFAAGLQLAASNNTQAIVGFSQVLLLTLWALLDDERTFWLSIPAFVQVLWLGTMVDDQRFLFAGIISVAAYNLALAQLKFSYMLHDWLAVTALFIAPLVYGLRIANPGWTTESYWLSFAIIFTVLLSLRYAQKLLHPLASSSGYLTALSAVYVLGFYVDPWFGFAVSLGSVLVLLLAERLESSSVFGYVAALLPLGILVHTGRSSEQALIAIVTVVVISTASAFLRKRRYEAYLGMFGSVAALWYAGTMVYDWSNVVMMSAYLGLATLLITGRLILKYKVVSFSDVLIVGYSITLGISLMYSLASPWQSMAVGIFLIGLFLTAVSYIENSPLVIIGSFLAGYGSLLSFTDGNNLSLNATIGLLLFVSQAVYWALVVSRFDTLRARYARGFQIFVAALIPIIGLGYFDRPIFPASLTLFGVILAREVWDRGQSAREIALFMVHLSGLWWLFALGVRELQIFTQATAVLLAGFAYWRRRLQDSPGVINQYLWSAVLIFSLPLIYQAVTSTNPAYSYLLLVEHVLLIVVSIVLKRATFAWWGIAVTVAAVLYQLRKLRYAALAFIGIFIISLAVYFLLKYNKPEQQK